MPMPDPTAGAIEAQRQSELATQAQSAQSQTSQTERVEKPTENDLSDGAQRLLHMQEDVTRAMDRYYKNPDQAYERLTQLDSEGREAFKKDPSTIGEMREGRTLTDDQKKGAATASVEYEKATPEAKREYAQHNAQSQAYETQQQAQQQEHAQKPGLTEQMNGQLTQSMASVHQIGSI